MNDRDDRARRAARLTDLRRAIADVDAELVDLLARRLSLAEEIGELKRALDLPVLDPAREAEVVRRGAALARERGVDPELVRDVLWRIMAQARGVQDAWGPTGPGGGTHRE